MELIIHVNWKKKRDKSGQPKFHNQPPVRISINLIAWLWQEFVTFSLKTVYCEFLSSEGLQMNKHENTKKGSCSVYQHQIRVWDLPTRLFHWLIVIFVVISFTTGMVGGNWMSYHLQSGYIILTLLIFRLGINDKSRK